MCVAAKDKLQKYIDTPIMNWMVLAPKLNEDNKPYLVPFSELLPQASAIVSNGSVLKVPLPNSSVELLLSVTRKQTSGSSVPEATLKYLLSEIEQGARSFARDLIAQLDDRFSPDVLSIFTAFGILDMKSAQWRALIGKYGTAGFQASLDEFGRPEMDVFMKHFGQEGLQTTKPTFDVGDRVNAVWTKDVRAGQKEKQVFKGKVKEVKEDGALRILWSDGEETTLAQNEYEGLESLEKVSFASPVAVAGLQAEWSQFKDAMFATSSNSARRPYILTVEQRKRDVLKDKLACSEAQQSYPNILKLLMREQVTPAGSMEVSFFK